MLGLGITLLNQNFTFGRYDISNGTYSGNSFSVNTQETAPRDVAFSSNGLAMFVIGSNSNTVWQYTLTTAFDVSTASYASKNKDVSTEEGGCSGLVFKHDGTKMYIIGFNNNTVYQYTLSTAWDVSTASYDSKSLSVSAEVGAATELAISKDGVSLYVLNFSNDTVYQYTLATPFDVSTGSYASKSKSITTEEASPLGLTFNGIGSKMYIAGSDSDAIHQYTLSTAWDVSTATYDNISLDVSTEDGTASGLTFNIHGTRIYIMGRANKSVYQYDI